MALIDWKESSKLVAARFPSFVRENAPNFVAFLAAYYDWLDTPGNPSWGISNFLLETDIDQTNDQFVDKFHDAYMVRIPRSVLADRRLISKHIKQFYRAKGTEQGFRFLFRILYGQEIDFYYPSRDVWRLDNSVWNVEQSLLVIPISGTDLNTYVSQQIVGSSSGARTRVESVSSRFSSGGVFLSEMFFASAIGAFVAGETILDYSTNEPIGVMIEWYDGSQSDSHGFYAYFTDGLPISGIPEANGFILSYPASSAPTLTANSTAISLTLPDGAGAVVYPGVYTDFDGHIDNGKYLQDDYYYQDFSYVIRSGVALSIYQQIVSDLLHPAGTKFFGQFRDTPVESMPIQPMSSSVITLNLYSTLPVELIQYVNAVLTTSSIPIPPVGFIYVDAMPILVSVTNFYIKTPRADVIAISNSETLSNFAAFTGAQLASWKGTTFTDGRGVLGVGNTSFLSYLSPIQTVIIVDRNGVNSPDGDVISTIDSNSTATLVFPYAGTLTSGQFVA